MQSYYFYLFTFTIVLTFHSGQSSNFEPFENPHNNIFQSVKSALSDVFENFPLFWNKIGETLSAAVEEDCEFQCPNGRKPKHNPYYQPKANGCGVPGLQIPKYIPVERLERCCNEHDICYGTCLKEKEKCDRKFKNCLYGICSSLKMIVSDETLNKACKGLAKTFYIAVLSGGCKYYLDAQKEACNCDINYYNEL